MRPAYVIQLASMRPRSIDRGRARAARRGRPWPPRFNEAAINRSRKGGEAGHARRVGRNASMRPRSIDRGREAEIAEWDSQYPQLQ